MLVNNILCSNIVIHVASQFFLPLKAAVSRILLGGCALGWMN